MLDSNQFLKELNDFTSSLLLAAKRGNYPLDAVVFDGMSEFDLMYEEVYQKTKAGNDAYAKWAALLSECFNLMQRLDPNTIGAHVLFTARIAEKRETDPDFVDFYYPSLRGQFKLNFPYYFNLVTFVEQRVENSLPVSYYHLIKTNKFTVKNQWTREWIENKIETKFPNMTFNELMKVLEWV